MADRCGGTEMYFTDSYRNGDWRSDMLGRYPGRDISWYGTGGYMSFEQVQLPVPSGYDAILRNFYGDYSKFVMGTSLHEGMLVSTDIPYEVLIKEIAWN